MIIPLPRSHPHPTSTSLLAFIALAGCSAAPARDPAPIVQPPPVVAPAARLDDLGAGASFQTVSSARFELSFPLPDARHFQIDDQSERWFVATHLPTSSILLVRAWREYELMDRRSCEERARLFRNLPVREGGVVIEDRRIDVPPEYDTMVEVRARVGTSRAQGSVLAFGARARKCFAFVFLTSGEHEDVVTARLSTITNGSLARMRFDDALVPKRKPLDLKDR